MPPKERGTVWVVDDSATDAERVAITLRDEYHIKIFHDGAAALEHLASSEPPDLLLLDWVMPGISGVEIASYVRSAPVPICQLPIILLTAQRHPEEITEAFKCGANDYVLKPFVEAELKARVRTLTSSKRHLGRAQALVKDLQRSEERLLLATSSAGVGIWEWDIRNGLIASTDIHRKIFELSTKGPIAFRDILEKIHPEDRAIIQDSLTEAIEKKVDYSSEFRLLKSDGTIAWIYGHGRAVLDEAGNPVRMVGIHQDVTAQKKAEADLKHAKEEAERANQLKSAFLANMSHEIRTPLGAMMGFAQLLQDPIITEMECAQYTEVLIRNGEQLGIIINDILDLSKVEAGLLSFEYRNVKPSEICADVLSLFKAKAKEQGLKLEYVCDPSTPERVATDPTRLRQILMNLVGNALKFTRRGSIVVRSYGAKNAESKQMLSIDVEDTGIGVASEQTHRIFNMFVQADDSITRKFGGTGLGLSLSKQLARELGGDLELKRSEVNVGSTFGITVVDQTEKIARAETRSDENAQTVQADLVSLDGIRVLVVDDAPDNQHLLSRYLTKRGAVVETADNGIIGYQQALSRPYDIVLMDLQMPLMDGYTATTRLRAEGFQQPIIALTAHAMTEVGEKCMEVGCSGYLPKPINQKDLLLTIARHVRPELIA